MSEDSKESPIIGLHYELPDGRIARTYGWGGLKRTVFYYFDDAHGGRTASEDEWTTWVLRDDLRDFPNAKDPRLPYSFDLVYDAKYRSQLVQIFKEGKEDDTLIEMMAEHGIELTKNEMADIEQYKETRSFRF